VCVLCAAMLYGTLDDADGVASAPSLPTQLEGTRARGGWHRAGKRRRREAGQIGSTLAEESSGMHGGMLRMVVPAVAAAALLVFGFDSIVAPHGVGTGGGAEDALALATTAARAQSHSDHGVGVGASTSHRGGRGSRGSNSNSWSVGRNTAAVVHVAPWGDDSAGGGVDDPLSSLVGAKAFVRAQRGIASDDDEAILSGEDDEATREFAPVDVVLAGGTHFLEPGSTLNLGPADSNVRWIAKSHWDAEQAALANGATTWEGVGSEQSVDQVHFSDSRDTTVSSGFQIPTDCWEKDESFPKDLFVYKCKVASVEMSDGSPAPHVENLKVLRIGDQVSEPARYPNLDRDAQYTNGYMLVNDYAYANGTYMVRLNYTLPAWLKERNFVGMVKYYPAVSWNNVIATISAATLPEYESWNLTYSPWAPYFKIECPITTDDACDGDDGKIEEGTRLYVYDNRFALTRGEWYFDQATQELFVHHDGGEGKEWMERVIIPTSTTLVSVRGRHFRDGVPTEYVRDIEFTGVTFEDTTFESWGFQSGFNVVPASTGIPDDLAFHIRGGSDIRVRHCAFNGTGGGGILATDASVNLTITHNRFHELGQTAIMLVGNATTQPTHVEIGHNHMQGLGRVLASAAGVFGSAVSNAHIHHNVITEGSRWGIAIRSNSYDNATAFENVVEFNKISYMGQQTKDFGGLSFIGYEGVPDVHTTVQFNCVRDNIGVHSSASMGILSPYMNYGIYLDNEASGYFVYGNVFKHAVTANVFFHEGRHNVVTNNVLADARNNGPIDEKSKDGGQVAFKSKSGWTENITFMQNIILWYNDSHNDVLMYDTSGEDDFEDKQFYIDHNLYWCVGASVKDKFLTNNDLTPMGNWLNWTGSGYDHHSYLTDPLFSDPAAGDYSFSPAGNPDSYGSPAHRIGFHALPEAVSWC